MAILSRALSSTGSVFRQCLLLASVLLCISTLAACEGGTATPGDEVNTTTDAGSGSDVAEDPQTGDGEVGGEDNGPGATSGAVPLVPTLAGGSAESDGFSVRFALTVPVASEAAESDSYRVNSGQFRFPTPPSEDPADETSSDE